MDAGKTASDWDLFYVLNCATDKAPVDLVETREAFLVSGLAELVLTPPAEIHWYDDGVQRGVLSDDIGHEYGRLEISLPAGFPTTLSQPAIDLFSLYFAELRQIGLEPPIGDWSIMFSMGNIEVIRTDGGKQDLQLRGRIFQSGILQIVAADRRRGEVGGFGSLVESLDVAGPSVSCVSLREDLARAHVATALDDHVGQDEEGRRYAFESLLEPDEVNAGSFRVRNPDGGSLSGFLVEIADSILATSITRGESKKSAPDRQGRSEGSGHSRPRRVGQWIVRPHVHLLRYEGQPRKRSEETKEGESLLWCLMAGRNPDEEMGELREARLPESPRAFDDFDFFCNEGMALWVIGADLEIENSATEIKSVPLQNQALSERVDYFYYAHLRLLDRSLDPNPLSPDDVLSIRRELGHLEVILGRVGRFGEIRRGWEVCLEGMDVVRLRNGIRSLLAARFDAARLKVQRVLARTGIVASVLLSFLGLPSLVRAWSPGIWMFLDLLGVRRPDSRLAELGLSGGLIVVGWYAVAVSVWRYIEKRDRTFV